MMENVSRAKGGVIIIIGRSFSGKNELNNELIAKGCDPVYLLSTNKIAGIDSYLIDTREFVENHDGFAGISAFNGEFFGVDKKEILSHGNSQKVVVATPGVAKALYGWSLKNNIVPFVVNMDISDAARSENMLKSGGNDSPSFAINEIDKKILEEISLIDIPIAVDVENYKPGLADAVLDRFEVLSSLHRSPINYKKERKTVIPEIGVREYFEKIDNNAKERSKYQSIAVSALAAGLFGAGNHEIAAAILTGFWMTKEAINQRNFTTSIFKEKGFSLADRAKYLILSGFTDPKTIDSIKTKDDISIAMQSLNSGENTNFLFKVIDSIERKFDDILVTVENMEEIKNTFLKEILSDAELRNRPSFFADHIPVTVDNNIAKIGY